MSLKGRERGLRMEGTPSAGSAPAEPRISTTSILMPEGDCRVCACASIMPELGRTAPPLTRPFAIYLRLQAKLVLANGRACIQTALVSAPGPGLACFQGQGKSLQRF